MEGEHVGSGTVCVTGASGFIGSWLVMRLLERGYFVRGTVRDPANIEKVKHLLELPNAGTHLSLWKADLAEEGSFDDAIQGCDGVFHVATPVFASVEDPENEAIKPTVNGVLNVMRSCSKAKNLKRFIYTSSIATVIMQDQPQPDQEKEDQPQPDQEKEDQPQPDQENKEQSPPDYDESCWTDVDFCKTRKMDGWVYCVAKTMGEKAAWKFAEENGIDLITIQPSIVIGPFISAPSISIALALVLITRNEAFYPTLYQAQAVHIDDVCNAHIYIFEHPQAKGRYICSSHCFTIMDLAKSLKQKYPERHIPTEFQGFDELLKPIPCSSKKLLELGFKFKYNPNEYDVGDLVSEAVESCKEKGILLAYSEGEGLSIPSLSQGQEIRKGERPIVEEII